MNDLRSLYLELLKKTLIDLNHPRPYEFKPAVTGRKVNWFVRPLLKMFQRAEKREFFICDKVSFDAEARMNGKDWPPYAETMIGYKRLSNVQYCVEEALRNGIRGDLMETGVWRGGTVIFMRAILKAWDCNDRMVWAADSFEGLPKPDAEKYAADKDDIFYTFDELRVTQEMVEENFKKYGLLDDQVRFLKGWFRDTLPDAPVQQLAVLRLDGDMYESTMDALTHLYPKLTPGGYLIIDDWGVVEGCRLAVEDYRKKHQLTEAIIPIDFDGVYWKKEKAV